LKDRDKERERERERERACEPLLIHFLRNIMAPSSIPATTIPAAGKSLDHALGTRLLSVYRRLSALPSLAPSPAANAAFTELVELCLPLYPPHVVDAVLGDEVIAGLLPQIRDICAEGEYQLEREWAERVCAGEAEIEGFPYWVNYEELVGMEVGALRGAVAEEVLRKGVVFLGSGPLPLSGMLFARESGVSVLGIDICPKAVELAGKVCAGQDPRMRFLCADAAELGGEVLTGFGVVYLAGLVGWKDWARKKEAIAKIVRKCNPGQVVALRSAEGLRKVLYQVCFFFFWRFLVR
jgi:nicotianamine synthase